jgi:hypothetical protein
MLQLNIITQKTPVSAKIQIVTSFQAPSHLRFLILAGTGPNGGTTPKGKYFIFGFGIPSPPSTNSTSNIIKNNAILPNASCFA